MTRGVLPAAALAVALAGVLAIELLPATAEFAAEPAARASSDAGASTPPEAPPLAAWTDVVLNRPLFAPDRRAPQTGTASRENLPRLAGTIRAEDTLLAIFEPDAGGKAIAAQTGAAVAGWKVTDIGDGAATLVRGGRTVTLRLSYADGPILAQPTAAPMAAVLHGKRSDPFLQP